MKKALAAIFVVALTMPAFAGDFLPPEGFGPKSKPPVEPRRLTNPIFVPPATFAKPGSQTPPATETKIPFTSDGLAIVVSGRINDTIDVDFALDSGAGLVTVPRKIYSALRRLGAVIASDIVGDDDFTLADGSTIREKIFIIQSLKVGDVTVHNVEAATTVGPTALLGQSFLMQFKSWKIDNSQRVIVFGYQ